MYKRKMKKNIIGGIIHGLVFFNDYRNPLDHIWIKKKYEVDLMSGKNNLIEEDSITKFYNEKRKWFKKRIKELKLKLKDFDKVIITVYGTKEKVEIAYKGKKYVKEQVYGMWIEREQKLRKDLAKLKPIDLKK